MTRRHGQAAPVLGAVLALALAGCAGGPAPAGVAVPAAAPTYRFLAGAESADQVALMRFTPCPAPDCGAGVERTYDVGFFPSDIEGPHGVIASHDGKAFYVSIAHGRPAGWLQKYDLETGRQLGQVELGMFPATVDIAPHAEVVYVINFNFDDPEMRPSSLSVVDGEDMVELARVSTCRMPHGSRVNPAGTMHYSGCMMNDLLVEVDARSLVLHRLFSLAPGHEGPVAPATMAAAGGMAHEGMDHGYARSNVCSPTWAQPSADGTRVYVACNKSNEIVEVDVTDWSLVRRWPTPKAPYNLAVTPDGKLLLATQKGPGTVSVWNLADHTLLKDIPASGRVASGIAVSADSRYAFATLEGVGGEPGLVDILDLRSLERVASIPIGKQAGGIAMLP